MRPSIQTFICGHDGCTERARYEYFNRAEARQQWERYGDGKYRCVRHTQPDSALSPDNLRREWSGVSDQREHGRYIGNFGFLDGPGFKFFAKDFPAGTTLRVTAEVILPASSELSERRTDAGQVPGMNTNQSVKP
jgi:hypothetical protein